MTPTDEQAHILSLAKTSPANLIIKALAGTGKTSTLEMAVRAVPQSPILYLVFNKRNADEAEKKMPGTVTVRTFNSLGHRIWAKAVGSVVLEPRKINGIFKGVIDEMKAKADRDDAWEVYGEVTQAVNLARALGYVPQGFDHATRLISRKEFHESLEQDPDDLVSDLIDEVLTRCIRQSYSGTIDFNDQIYMPALFGGAFAQFPLVMMDEAQDMSPVNHQMIAKMSKNRLIAVGDPFQAIYGFRGAVAEGMEDLRQRYQMEQATLSVSFRCPQAIVENARWRAPEFKWTKPGGTAEELKELSFEAIPDGAAILCRNNAPLVKMAMRLIQAKRSVSVAGSEIGPRIVKQLEKLGDSSMSRASLLSAIDDWETEKLAKNNKIAQDMAACMRVFAEFGDTLGQAVAYATHLFALRGSIQLLTGHKAKGLEFAHVIHIDPWIIKTHQQDLNLRYVIQTRSLNYYAEVDSVMVG